MFEHGKYKFYSIREKINYYSKVLSGKIFAPKAKRKAKNRLKTLKRLNSLSYDEPQLIITNDRHFGNKIEKPRACVVFDKDAKGRLLVSPIEHRTSKAIILNKNMDRQFGTRRAWIDRSEVYETKYITGLSPLTKYDKEKAKHILLKK